MLVYHLLGSAYHFGSRSVNLKFRKMPPPKRGRVRFWHHPDGSDGGQILADILGKTEGAIRSLQHRGERALARLPADTEMAAEMIAARDRRPTDSRENLGDGREKGARSTPPETS